MQLRFKSVCPQLVSRLVLAVLCWTQAALPIQAFSLKPNITRRLVVVDTITGTIKGRVIDRAGRGIPQVTVVMVNLDTNNPRATRTNEDGYYAIAALPHGIYEIKVSKQGYVLTDNPVRQAKTSLNKPIDILPDIIMSPGPITPLPPPPVSIPPPVPPPVSEEILTGQLTNQGDATRRANFEEKLVLALPLADGRTFDTLATLAAGVAPPP
ncbi:MAG: carboxypeptidase regulatory-like domain-containing protein, partial [Acidobacteria bacterium]|nr:carboxypeptidase regulatory-like domain-containing protein [Acidobacteriota bacterium]